MPTAKESRIKNKAKRRNNRKQKNRLNWLQYKQDMLALIRTYDDPILKQKCDKVQVKDLSALMTISKMKKILAYTQNGVGLAAPQIGITKQIFIFREKLETGVFKVMINPEIISHGDIILPLKEGCLSFPETIVNVDRYIEITVSYLDENFEAQEKTFVKFVAKIIQHEIEHLSGICKVGEAWEREQFTLVTLEK